MLCATNANALCSTLCCNYCCCKCWWCCCCFLRITRRTVGDNCRNANWNDVSMYCCLGLCSFCCCCCFSSAAIELFFSQLPAFYIFSGMNSESWCSHNYMCINIYLYRYVCVRSLHMYRKNHTRTLWLHGVKISDRHSNSGKFDSFNMCLCEFW